MNILVIGGAGYIGSHVTRELIDRGHHTTVYDNLSLGLRENLFAESTFIEGDILDSPSLDRAMSSGSSKFDAIIHLAAFKAAGESMVDPGKYAVNNISGTINILNAAVRAGVRLLVFSSSAAVYGEPAYLPIDEEHPTKPENFYGFTKLEIERLLGWYDKLKGVRYAALRYFNAAGYDPKGRVHGLERNPANLLPVIMEVAIGKRPMLQIFGDDYDTEDGTGVRDYIHVSDLAAAHALALERLARGEQSLTVNLGSEQGMSVRRLLEAARRITGRNIPEKVVARRPGDPARLVATSKLAKKLLGWTPTMSSLDSLVETSWRAYFASSE
ncbi:MAG TPA: UDP-glucose 4-epimerase GalE [Spirochaetia bacterium]|nr:UDP-glucose 4-epimerase GalE [Spirochaetia bacterium]